MNKMQRRQARRSPMPMAFSSSQFPPSPISNAHPVGSRCGDRHWPNLPSARYFTACTVPAFCAMVLASGLQSTDSDTNSSRLTALAEDSHWNPVHAYAPFREAPRPTTGSLQHRQGIAWFWLCRPNPSAGLPIPSCLFITKCSSHRAIGPNHRIRQLAGSGSLLTSVRNTCRGRTLALSVIGLALSMLCILSTQATYSVLGSRTCSLRGRFTLILDWNGRAPEPRSFPRLDSDDVSITL
ncbi:hypothetical protein CABS01_16080 [Colletotrichum abscissum]|uniref:uncharacterized protein n=1 Tax=Colletotrichum abscissum TaxID=1671311 RepID=UPI0027D47FE9|nr:uncharacterized protein CABS01_16080 [Colletotrichum abscissum]KAK1472937.1 hypothetical protein CABS01_16080 [Colletotrichum abscissum]